MNWNKDIRPRLINGKKFKTKKYVSSSQYTWVSAISEVLATIGGAAMYAGYASAYPLQNVGMLSIPKIFLNPETFRRF
jgi:hypothetical protein